VVVEHEHPGGVINNVGDAAFFTAAQLLTVSSSMPNPVTAASKVADIGPELWAIVVITAAAGSFATFLQLMDS
jgi:hypothetical protein